MGPALGVALHPPQTNATVAFVLMVGLLTTIGAWFVLTARVKTAVRHLEYLWVSPEFRGTVAQTAYYPPVIRAATDRLNALRSRRRHAMVWIPTLTILLAIAATITHLD